MHTRTHVLKKHTHIHTNRSFDRCTHTHIHTNIHTYTQTESLIEFFKKTEGVKTDNPARVSVGEVRVRV